ncbi:MAG: lipopolysaccharide export LptBFGC system permease protein LptF [Lentimonas sp.]|jgi:lipopolysaccharide export LptBFGC system permease protein LptF
MKKIFLIFGIIFTVLSIVIFNFVVSKNDMKMTAINGEIRQVENKIERSWRNNQNRWTALQNIVLYSQNHSIEDKLLKDVFNIDQDIQSVFDLIEKEKILKQNLQNKIDEIYLSKINLQDQLMSLEKKNNQFKNIAILLNIIGLVLILISKEQKLT